MVVFEAATGAEVLRKGRTKDGPDGIWNYVFFDPTGRVLLPVNVPSDGKRVSGLWDLTRDEQAAIIPGTETAVTARHFQGHPSADGSHLGTYVPLTVPQPGKRQPIRLVRVQDLQTLGEFDMLTTNSGKEMAYLALLARTAAAACPSTRPSTRRRPRV